MARPTWQKQMSEAISQETVFVEKTGKTGNSYTAEVAPRVEVLSTGNVTDNRDGSYTYNIVDDKAKLDYAIKANKLLDVHFGTKLAFVNVTGGQLEKGGGSWFKAEDVLIVK